MDNPKVSAVITTHNRLELLKRAIESVKSQTYKNLECIVVSDNSSDGTNEYCSSLEGICFISIPPKESHGGNYARNLGIKKASGVYVAFLDDDDYWKPTKIEKQVLLIKDKKCGVVYCRATHEVVENHTIKYQEYFAHTYFEGNVAKKILTSIFTTTSELLVEKDLLIKVGMFDENLKFWQEYDLSIRLAQESDFFCCREALIVYRINKKDAARLTNKYSGWRQTVKYLHDKHHKLYATLNYKEKLCYKQFVWQEAISRCENSGLIRLKYYYRLLLWFSIIPIRIKRAIGL